MPYYVANQAVLLRESLNVTTEDDLAGLKIGAQMGTTGAYYVEDNWEGGSIASYNSYPDLSAAILALNANTVNALVVDTPVAYRYANDTAYDYKVAFVIETNENYGIAIPKDSPGLKLVIDNILARAAIQW
ncbi:MAG: transporter substrate-binding domain-containing protein [Desulfobacterales bacterium]|nr:transporter substrate-binding domain-containing protein [Desulfobacterales bacterium]